MTRRRLDWALRARGTCLVAWPPAERGAALALLGRSGTAREALADALAAEDAPTADPPALCRMQQAVRRRVAPPPAAVRGMGWGAMAACAAAGLYLGASVGVSVGVGEMEPDFFISAPDPFTATATPASLDE